MYTHSPEISRVRRSVSHCGSFQKILWKTQVERMYTPHRNLHSIEFIIVFVKLILLVHSLFPVKFSHSLHLV